MPSSLHTMQCTIADACSAVQPYSRIYNLTNTSWIRANIPPILASPIHPAYLAAFCTLPHYQYFTHASSSRYIKGCSFEGKKNQARMSVEVSAASTIGYMRGPMDGLLERKPNRNGSTAAPRQMHDCPMQT